jgi:SAM-dependent methyltransferase
LIVESGELEYQRKIAEEARFWGERAELLLRSGRIPLWFDHRRGEDVTFVPLGQLRGAGIRANPILYRIVYGNMMSSIIREATQKKGYALDLGCGCGWLSLELARHGMYVDGYDISPTQIDIARRFSQESQESSDPLLHGDYGSTDYQVVDLNRVALEEGKYEAVVSIGTLHHVQCLDHLLGEIHKSLKPDGRFILYEYIGYYGLSRIFPLFFKAARALPKLAKWIAHSNNVATSSPFEGVSQGQILESVERRFLIQKIEFKFLFLLALVSGLRIYRQSHTVSVPLVKFLYRVDTALANSKACRGPYVFAIARKR